MKDEIKVSIIIVNYNTAEMTSDCIKSIIDRTKNLIYEIIIVDNGSSDKSIESFSNFCKEYSFIRLIRLANNIGFGRANNLGVTNAKGEYVFLLNSDTILLNDAVNEFYKKASSYDREYILGSYLYDNNGNICQSYSDFQDIPHIIVRIAYMIFPLLLSIRMKIKPIYNDGNAEKDVDFITGADMFMKTSVFTSIGGFDENIFMYGEDEIFCAEALKKGIKSKVIKEPRIVHLEGQSSKSSMLKKKNILKSYIYLIKKRMR